MDKEPQAVSPPPLPNDFVVIDRAILRQALEAVVHTLEATARLEQLRAAGSLDKVTFVELSLQLREARDSLAAGLASVLSSLDKLPSVDLKKTD